MELSIDHEFSEIDHETLDTSSERSKHRALYKCRPKPVSGLSTLVNIQNLTVEKQPVKRWDLRKDHHVAHIRTVLSLNIKICGTIDLKMIWSISGKYP